MRYEWTEAIRYRRWTDLETLAKREPSQQLCDTLYELLLGIEEPGERKILKRALYLVKLAGFTPSIEAEPAESKPRLPSLVGFGTMHSSDTHGYMAVSAAVVKGDQIYSALIIGSDRWRVSKATVNAQHARLIPALKKYVLEKSPTPLSAEIETGYALHRMRRLYENQIKERGSGKLTGIWKQLFTRVPLEFPHPALKFPAAKDVQSQERRQLMSELATVKWRLPLAPDNEIWERIHPIRWDTQITAEKRRELMLQVLMDTRAQHCTDENVDDFSLRLLDCALLLGEGDPMSMRMLEAERDLRKRRFRSEIFEEILVHTADGIEKDVEEDEFEGLGFPSYNSSDWD